MKYTVSAAVTSQTALTLSPRFNASAANENAPTMAINGHNRTDRTFFMDDTPLLSWRGRQTGWVRAGAGVPIGPRRMQNLNATHCRLTMLGIEGDCLLIYVKCAARGVAANAGVLIDDK